MTGVALACALLTTLVAPTSSHARKPGCEDDVGVARVERPRWSPASGLELTEEHLEFDCDRGADRHELRCAWSSRHVYVRTSTAQPFLASTLTFQPDVSRVEELRVRVNGEAAELDGAQLGQASIRDDGSAAQVVVEITFTARWRSTNAAHDKACGAGHIHSPAQFRHLLVARPQTEWVVSTAASTSEDERKGELDVEVRGPVWQVTLATGEFRNTRYVIPPVTWSGDRRSHRNMRRTILGRGVPEPRRYRGAGARGVHGAFDSDDAVEVRLSKVPFPGGVFVGLGGALLDVDRPLRGRVGFEAAAPRERPLIFHSLALETDFRTALAVVPGIELTHGPRRLRWMPRVGLGTGVPLQVLGEVRPGLRSFGTLNLPIVGFVVTLDWYPRFRPGQSNLAQLGLLGELRF